MSYLLETRKLELEKFGKKNFECWLKKGLFESFEDRSIDSKDPVQTECGLYRGTAINKCET